ncbi:hypothetical protein ACFVVA_00520 [Kitasatospora sp. NPDC058048]|uniref:hypothetical protein n=1 Tax=Kitasatospora sp. NPDC058048 TaxID=3346313 RepID=UPI0036DDB324
MNSPENTVAAGPGAGRGESVARADQGSVEAVDETPAGDELPLWGTELPLARTEDRQAPESADLPDLRAQLYEVAEAWKEAVPEGRSTAGDLRAVLEADVEALQVHWQHVAALPDASEAPAADGTGHVGTRSAAMAVNAALRAVDRHALALRAVPEWQQLRTVRDAVSWVWDTLAERAGESAGRLLDDRRVAEFLRNVSVRACETIARLSRLAADRLRPDRAALPSAEALLALGNAASAYGRSARRPGDLPTGEALLVLGGGPRPGEPWA